MKMAKASEADLSAALKVSQIIEELEKGFMPTAEVADDAGFFDSSDPEKCFTALTAILDAARQGSIFRVALGMYVILDPRNEIVDPEAETLEVHPKITAALERQEQLSCKLYTYKNQPMNNEIPWRLGEACNEAMILTAGDYIDRGLGLLKMLEARGYGIVPLATTPEQPSAPETDNG